MIFNNFNGDLRFSHKYEPFWSEIYQDAFPTLLGHMPVENIDLQKMGIDRMLNLSGGKLLFTEEKMRRGVYTDILLEYMSDSQRKTPGWIEKDLKCNFLAYAFLPNRTCFLFPWEDLRNVWATFKPLFLQNYLTVEAYNPNYSTLSVAIPIEILQGLIPTTIKIVLNS